MRNLSLKKQIEPEEVKVFSKKKSSVLRNLIKKGRLRKKDWAEESEEKEEEDE